MKCKYGYTSDTMSSIVQQGINSATLGDLRNLESSGVHIVDSVGDCMTCAFPPYLAILKRPMKDFLEWAELGGTSSIWQDLNDFVQWMATHSAHIRHVESVGEISLIWCGNCGLWVDDDTSSSAQDLMRAPVEDVILATLRTQEPLQQVGRCILCTEEAIEDRNS